MGLQFHTDDVIRVPVSLVRINEDVANIRAHYHMHLYSLTEAWIKDPKMIPPVFVALKNDHLMILDGVLRFMALEQAIARGANIEEVDVCIQTVNLLSKFTRTNK